MASDDLCGVYQTLLENPWTFPEFDASPIPMGVITQTMPEYLWSSSPQICKQHIYACAAAFRLVILSVGCIPSPTFLGQLSQNQIDIW